MLLLVKDTDLSFYLLIILHHKTDNIPDKEEIILAGRGWYTCNVLESPSSAMLKSVCIPRRSGMRAQRTVFAQTVEVTTTNPKGSGEMEV